MRHGRSPKRRIWPVDALTGEERDTLAKALVYVGSGHHKTKPSDYGFRPPVSPRPWKSICDGIRIIPLAEARQLFQRGIENGMVSPFPKGEVPKYVWSVDDSGHAYEAKIGLGGYHGYRLEEEDQMRSVVLKEWTRRCKTS